MANQWWVDEKVLQPGTPPSELLRASRSIYEVKSRSFLYRILDLCTVFNMFVSIVAIAGFVAVALTASSNTCPANCDTITNGYQCSPEISHYWGQYSPYFSVPSPISAEIPQTCKVTFAQILSRHGARDPTAAKTASYSALISKIQTNTSSYGPGYEFIRDYQYTLGADQLTLFGQQEMINSGIKFARRYSDLVSKNTPFVRSSGEDRVVESAVNWTQGFYQAKISNTRTDTDYPYPIVVIPETSTTNNTLNHGLCTSFESGPYKSIGSNAQTTYQNIFIPPIQSRINSMLIGASLSSTEIIYLMDLCPFNTVASPTGQLSPFCNLFTHSEWDQYNYYESLGKYYGYSFGNPLGPTQGVGWVVELIARLTKTAVNPQGSVNRTLDADPATFPLDRAIYADFSHDNDITAALSALGLYNSSTTPMLPMDHVVEAEAEGGYSAAYTVPFASRVYVEKYLCSGAAEERVRVVVNDRVATLTGCATDGYGGCGLGSFVGSLDFAKTGGKWNLC